MRPGIKLKIFKRLSVFFFSLLLFYSCTEKKADKELVKKDTLVFATENVKYTAADTTEWEPDYPSGTTKYAARVLTASAFHRDEIDPKSDEYKWKGLFKTKSGYYTADTDIKLALFDDIFDDNGKPLKGLEVIPGIQDSTIILVSGINFPNRPVQEINLAKGELLPGEQQEFLFKDVKYTLYATGNKKSESANKNYYTISNYKMFVKATVNGKHYNQLLVSIPRATDTMGQICFVGDIDGDNIPDFVIDTAFEENIETTTLYLSGEAENDDLLKVVGRHLTTGC